MRHSPAFYDSLATQIRRDILRMVYDAQSGHPGGSMGCVEYFMALYYELMRFDPGQFTLEGKGEDVFVLSNGHITPVFYSVLARVGYFPLDELATFRKIDSRLQGHPSPAKGLPGIRIATGSLGQGFSVALGMGLAKRLDDDPGQVFVLLGDGELQEGQIWEAANFAQHHQIDNVLATVDLNYKQIDGDTREVMDTAELRAKWEAFNWQVVDIPRGNDFHDVLQGLSYARTLLGQGRPVVVLLRTIMGKGVDFMEDRYEWHGKSPGPEQYEQALAQLPETLGDYVAP